jgi:hypothetical protein
MFWPCFSAANFRAAPAPARSGRIFVQLDALIAVKLPPLAPAVIMFNSMALAE